MVHISCCHKEARVQYLSRTADASINAALIPTPKKVSDLTALTFVGDHPNDLKTGIQPFAAMDGLEDHHVTAQDLAQNYKLLAEREFGMNVAYLAHSYVQMSSKPTTKPLSNWKRSFFGSFIHVILGANLHF